ncbi:MAG TPA: class I SAM-dependent methyltransferase, partial [Amaricoccus sp.]|nr:class I SAM-dependent methyltransferase [Amaricoccus sp.]
LYDAPEAVPERGFDLVFVTWGAIGWLPDIRGWARVVAGFLRPGGRLLLVEGHPAAMVFDDEAPPSADGMPGFFVPYFDPAALATEEADYANPAAPLAHRRTYTWLHPLGAVASALVEAGLGLVSLREHDAVPWRMFARLVGDDAGLYRWPDRPWLPLSYALVAEKRG